MGSSVTRVLQDVTRMIRRHRMLEPGSTVVVAVSGGPDSLCLLHAMVRLQRLLRVEPVCFHFDHHLRPGSASDAAYVRGQARKLGVPFVLREAHSTPNRGASVEAWARTVRYEALAAAAEEQGGVAAVGHTADDQAETVLLALLRGGGLDAVSAMKPVTRPVVRPLLETTREQTEAFCRALRLRPRRDPMNEDPAYLRVGIRDGVIPLLEERLGRNVRSSLARSAALLERDAGFLEGLAAEATSEVMAGRKDGTVELHAKALRDLPEALSTRVVRTALLEAGLAPAAAHIQSVLTLSTSRPGSRVLLGKGLLAERGREYVRLSRPSPHQTVARS